MCAARASPLMAPMPRAPSVSTAPGLIRLTRMPREASSTASTRMTLVASSSSRDSHPRPMEETMRSTIAPTGSETLTTKASAGGSSAASWLSSRPAPAKCPVRCSSLSLQQLGISLQQHEAHTRNALCQRPSISLLQRRAPTTAPVPRRLSSSITRRISATRVVAAHHPAERFCASDRHSPACGDHRRRERTSRAGRRAPGRPWSCRYQRRR